MPTISRSSKTGGGTDLNTGQVAVVADINTDTNLLFNTVNALDNDNIASGAAIDSSKLAEVAIAKVSDLAATDAEFVDTGTSPGDTASPTKPTDLSGEIEALRYRIAANNSYTTGLEYTDTGGTSTATDGWLEPAIVGRNLLPNPGFEVQSGAANSAPDGWSLVLTPTTVDIVVPSATAAGLEKKSLRILADEASCGIDTTVSGLKPSTKYLIGMAYTLTTGSVNLVTTGALGSGDYQNLALQDASAPTTYTTLQGIVKTDATPSDVVVRILSSADLDDFNVFYVWMYEMSEAAPFELPHIPMQTAEDATEAVYPASPTTPAAGVIDWEEITPLSLSQYIPHPGYRLVYEVTVNWNWDENRANGVGGPSDSEFTHAHHGVRIQVDDGGGAAVVEGPHMIFTSGMAISANHADGHIVTLKHVVERPTPGATYSFRVDMGVAAATSDYAWAIVNPLVDTQQGRSTARLYTERL